MAAGVIYQTVTTTSGETVELAFYVDDTGTPTQWLSPRLNVNASGAAVAFGSGANGATVPRVALATDSPGVIATGTIGNGNLSATILSVDTPAHATSIAKLEDAASADGDKGVPAMAVRKATPADTSGSDGDYEMLQVKDGQLWVASKATDKTLLSERVIAGGSHYETVAASQTDQALGATGAAGDYLESLICVVSTAATSQVQIKDGAGSAITILPNDVGAGVGTYILPVGLISLSGAWKVTTAAGVAVIGTGRFT